MIGYKIDLKVPLPTEGRGRHGGPFKALATAPIGASIFLENILSKNACRNCAYYGRGWYTVRTVKGGVRAWKLEEPAFPQGKWPRKKITA